ncbi:MAG: hypothetical protein KC478_09245 [Bacteriovoracaceae bacterium]|nr:hypothetical protein [Bacteriovoracaceae bacterium]
MKKLVTSIVVSLFIVPAAIGAECSEKIQMERNLLATQIFERQNYAEGYLMALSGFSEPVAFEDAANFQRDKVAGRLNDLELQLKMIDAKYECQKELPLEKNEFVGYRACLGDKTEAYKELGHLQLAQAAKASFNEGYEDAVSILKTKLGSKSASLDKMLEKRRQENMKEEINNAHKIKRVVARACGGSLEDSDRSIEDQQYKKSSDSISGRAAESN